jgi:hypothetical protein
MEEITSTYSTERSPEHVVRVKRRRDWVMWIVVLGVPSLFLGHMQIIYSISLWSHRSHKTWPMHVGAVISLLLCFIAGIWSWRSYRGAYSDKTPELEEVEEERLRMTAHLAHWGTALFILGIIAQWVAVFMIDPAID